FQAEDGIRDRTVTGVQTCALPILGADLELLARFLVDMRRAQHRELLDLGRQRDRSPDARAGALGGIDDLAGGLVEHAVIVGAQPNTDILVVAYHSSCAPLACARSYFKILATTPAPTVRPPSRIAKRRP